MVLSAEAALLDAASCHAGILAGLPSWENGLPEFSRATGKGVAEGTVAFDVEPVGVCDTDVDPFASDLSAGVLEETVACGSGEGVGVGAGGAFPEPSLLVRRTFKLFSSALSSRSRFSLPSLEPSIAFGIPSFRPRTSSLIRLVSSSRLREEDLSSATTSSTSRRAVSSRSVLESSAAFSAAVSVESWSRRVKARLNCSSMLSLSCCSCGGVGGAIKGVMYRYQ